MNTNMTNTRAFEEAVIRSSSKTFEAFDSLEKFLQEKRWDLTPLWNKEFRSLQLAAEFWNTASESTLNVFDEWTRVADAINSTPRK